MSADIGDALIGQTSLSVGDKRSTSRYVQNICCAEFSTAGTQVRKFGCVVFLLHAVLSMNFVR